MGFLQDRLRQSYRRAQQAEEQRGREKEWEGRCEPRPLSLLQSRLRRSSRQLEQKERES